MVFASLNWFPVSVIILSVWFTVDVVFGLRLRAFLRHCDRPLFGDDSLGRDEEELSAQRFRRRSRHRAAGR